MSWPNLPPAYTSALQSQDVYAAPGALASVLAPATGGVGLGESVSVPSVVVESTLVAATSVSSSQGFLSSMNGTSWSYVTSTLAGLSPPPVGPSPPSGPPTIPAYVSATPSSITVTTDAAGVTGNPVPTYHIRYRTAIGGTFSSLSTTLVSGTTWGCTVSSLMPSTSYLFQASANNTLGERGSPTSTYSTLYTAASTFGPSAAPTIPQSNAVTSNSIGVFFNVAGVSGTPPPTFSTLYGTTTSPTTPAIATLSTGNIYTSLVTSLTPATTYYFESLAGNSVGVSTSAASIPITTLGGNFAPSAPPPPQIFNSTSMVSPASVWFDTAGVTGNPAPTYTVLYRYLDARIPAYVSSIVPATLSTGTIYSASFPVDGYGGDPAWTQSYGVFSIASSIAGGASSIEALSFFPYPPTPAALPTVPAGPVVIADGPDGGITSTTIAITARQPVSPSTITGNPTPFYYTLYGTSPSTLNNSTPLYYDTWGAGGWSNVIRDLEVSTTYYFQPITYNAFSSIAWPGPPVAISTLGGPIPATPPAPPSSIAQTESTITWTFQTGVQTGSPPFSYSLLVNGSNLFQVTEGPPSTFTGTATGLAQQTNYTAQGVATNPAGSVSSLSSIVTGVLGPATVGGAPFQLPTAWPQIYAISTYALAPSFAGNPLADVYLCWQRQSVLGPYSTFSSICVFNVASNVYYGGAAPVTPNSAFNVFTLTSNAYGFLSSPYLNATTLPSTGTITGP